MELGCYRSEGMGRCRRLPSPLQRVTVTREIPSSSALPSAIISAKHIPALDGVRGLAVLMILIGHLYQKRLLHEWELATLVLGRLLAPCYLGVDLFFMLSGFLITGILVDNLERPGSFIKFYVRRFLRIFPL